jgi:hypothetical protein
MSRDPLNDTSDTAGDTSDTALTYCVKNESYCFIFCDARRYVARLGSSTASLSKRYMRQIGQQVSFSTILAGR